MTAPVFVDTAALIALISRDDTWHAQTHEQFAILAKQRRTLLTSSAVLYELLDGAASRGTMRAAAIRLVRSIRDSPQWTIIHVTDESMRKGEALYITRMDKLWSLTDCTNMEIAREHEVQEIMSTDNDYEQGGFRVLLRV